jgi:apolipoprotein N-acyltransferase
MKLSRATRLLLSLASGVALAMAYPLYNIPILIWVALVPLLVAVIGERPRVALLLGILHGAVYIGFSVPWIYTVIHVYGPIPAVQSAAVFLALALARSLFHAAFAFLVAWLGERSSARALLAAPLLWTAMEFSISRLPDIAFPWNLLGYAASGNLAFLQLTTVTGIFGLSLAVGYYNALVAWTLMQFSDGRRVWKPLVGVTAVLVIGGLAGPMFVPAAAADRTAHLVQTNFPVSNGYPPNWMDTHAGELDELEKISIEPAQKTPGIIIWPEVPAPFSLQDPKFLARAQHIARGSGQDFLVGVVDWRRLPDGKFGVTNSAALLDSAGALDFMYDKIHLVPFSEYVPWRTVWRLLTGTFTSIVSDFQKGTQYKVGAIPGGTFGTFICYEAIFPNEIRRFTLGGAQVLINISDDAWFGGSGAAEQHLAMAHVRAVENRRWLLRDTNDGITVSIDPYGRIVKRMASSVRGEMDAPYAFRQDLTFYTRTGDWIAWLCVGAGLVLLLMSVTTQKAARHDA